MRLLIIPDIHGLDTWKRVVVAEPDVDHILFVGDYFDAFDVSIPDQLANFDAILDFRQNQPAGRVTLLLGNHDYHYLSYVVERFSGYGFATQRMLRTRIDELVKTGVLTMAAYVDGRLYTHAGVTKTWAADWGIDAAPQDLPGALDELMHHRSYAFTFHSAAAPGYADPAGDDVWQGPLWVRPRSLRADAYCSGQIVGHTVLPEGVGIEPHPVAFSCDALFRGQFLLVEDGLPLVRQL